MYCWFSPNPEHFYWYFVSKGRFYCRNENLEHFLFMEAKFLKFTKCRDVKLTLFGEAHSTVSRIHIKWRITLNKLSSETL